MSRFILVAAALALLDPRAAAQVPSYSQAEEARFRREREAMTALVSRYEPGRRVTDPRVLAAMRKVPRHLFVPREAVSRAYEDGPVHIGEGQTISQPFIVGYMTQLLEPKPSDRVLEIGTGSGYQAAILAELVRHVYTIEILEPLGKRADGVLKGLGYRNVSVRVGDGYLGWPEHAPFDAIIVTCAPDHIPRPLLDQLKTGGRLVIPVGPDQQDSPWTPQKLYRVRKTKSGLVYEKTLDVSFVVMQGKARSR